MADKFKFALALLLLAGGVVGFYLLIEHAMVWRVLAVCAGVIVSATVAWQTEPGRQFFEFTKDAKKEVEKVVWPTSKETLQATFMVFVFVIVMALFLWVTDKTLEWVLYDLVLGWRKS